MMTVSEETDKVQLEIHVSYGLHKIDMNEN
jgi:hypothetical protein